MDIAEIRKKAKSGKLPDEKPESGKASRLEETEAVSAQAPAAEDMSAGLPDETVETPRLVDEETTSGLDKLFAETKEFELATEEAYHELLSGQQEDHDRARQQFLAFNLGKEEYALDIRTISEIIKLREFTDIPRAPDFILGIISLRGVVVPVFDLMRRFRLGETTMTGASRIIVCQDGDLQAGLLVDSINQVVQLEDRQIEPPPAILTGFDRDLVRGVGRFQGRMIILLHLASVLDVQLK